MGIYKGLIMFIKILKDIQIVADVYTIGKISLAKDSYLDHVKLICKSLSTDNHTLEYQYGLLLIKFYINKNDYEIINEKDIPIP